MQNGSSRCVLWTKIINNVSRTKLFSRCSNIVYLPRYILMKIYPKWGFLELGDPLLGWLSLPLFLVSHKSRLKFRPAGRVAGRFRGTGFGRFSWSRLAGRVLVSQSENSWSLSWNRAQVTFRSTTLDLNLIEAIGMWEFS